MVRVTAALYIYAEALISSVSHIKGQKIDNVMCSTKDLTDGFSLVLMFL